MHCIFSLPYPRVNSRATVEPAQLSDGPKVVSTPYPPSSPTNPISPGRSTRYGRPRCATGTVRPLAVERTSLRPRRPGWILASLTGYPRLLEAVSTVNSTLKPGDSPVEPCQTPGSSTRYGGLFTCYLKRIPPGKGI